MLKKLLTTVGLLAVSPAVAVAAPPAAHAAAPSPTHYTGTLADSTTWVGDVPSNWNGSLVLYSHGFGNLTATDAPNEATQAALLARGYALVGSSYHGPSLWAVASAPKDQFAALAAITRQIGEPRRVFALGTSMGGLISALEDQTSHRRLDGVLTTCGLVGGGVNLNNYQLDGEYAIARLLAPGQRIKLVNYANSGEAQTAIQQLTAAVTTAQRTPAGRARIALAAALLNTPDWITGNKPPTSPSAREDQQAQWLLTQLQFVIGARPSIEQAVGGNASWNVGVDYERLIRKSANYRQVRSLYRSAGLSLGSDLRKLTANADIRPDLRALHRLSATAVPTGHLSVPELTMHTTADQLSPLAFESWYGGQVRAAGDGSLLRQSYVQAIGHCNFTPSEIVAGLQTVQQRVDTRRWLATTATALNRRAAATGLGPANFVGIKPSEFVNARTYWPWALG